MIISWFPSSSFWYRCFVWMCLSGGLFSEFSYLSRVIVQLVGHGFCIDIIWLHSLSDGCKVVIIAYKRCDGWWVFCNCNWMNWAT